MSDLQVLIAALFVSAAGLNALARWLSVPYPIVLVLGGLLLGLVPGCRTSSSSPTSSCSIFLPPLLYSAAFFSDLRALRDDIRAISITAIGLVLLTTGAVAVVAHEVIGLTWPMAFALGRDRLTDRPGRRHGDHAPAGRPPADRQHRRGREPGQRRHRPGRLPGRRGRRSEGRFSVLDAGLEFLGAVAGGIAVGLVVGFVVTEIRRRLDDTIDRDHDLAADRLRRLSPGGASSDVSGVLAAVVAGVYLGWRAPEISTPADAAPGHRRLGGARLPAQRHPLHPRRPAAAGDRRTGSTGCSTGELIGYSALVCATRDRHPVRLGVHHPYLIRALDRRQAQRARRVAPAPRVVVALVGDARRRLAGGGARAAARNRRGRALPGRDLILFITFAVILVTVVGQGLTLPALIRRLGVVEDSSEEEARGDQGAAGGGPGRARAPR